jgi:hypothetical protein
VRGQSSRQGGEARPCGDARAPGRGDRQLVRWTDEPKKLIVCIVAREPTAALEP